MKKFLIYTFLTLFAAIAFSSCSNSDDPNKEPQNILVSISDDITFTAVSTTDKPDTWQTFDGALYNVAIDREAKTCAFLVSKLRYAIDKPQLDIMVEAIPGVIETDKTMFTLMHEGAVQAIGNDNKYHTVSNIKINILMDPNRMVNFEGKDVLEYAIFISFTLDNAYNVHTVQKVNYYFGKTTTANGAFPKFTTDETVYRLSLDPSTRMATVDLLKPMFASQMPAFSRMIFAKIPYTLTTKGIKFSTAELEPSVYMADAILDAEGFSVTDLDGIMTFPLTTGEYEAPQACDLYMTFSVTGMIRGQSLFLGDVTAVTDLKR